MEENQIRDELVGALIGLVRATEGNEYAITEETERIIAQGTAVSLGSVKYDDQILKDHLTRVDREKRRIVPNCYSCAAPCGRTSNYDLKELQKADDDVRLIKEELMKGLGEIAPYIYRTILLGEKDTNELYLLYRTLYAIGMNDWGRDELAPIAEELSEIRRNYHENTHTN